MKKMEGRMVVLLLVTLAAQASIQAEEAEAQGVEERLQVMPGIHR